MKHYMAKLILGLFFSTIGVGSVLAEDLKIGLITTLSGGGGYLGQDVRDGFLLAIKEEGGKLGGKSVKVLVEDDGRKPENGRAIAERFIERDGVEIMTGIIFSNISPVVAPLTLRAGRFYITPNSAPSQFAGEKCHENYFAVAWQNDSLHESAGLNATSQGYKNAYILAPNYQTPEIYHGIADFSADSLALAVEASKTSADIIVMAGVHFMAETAKLMSPNKKVLLPDMDAGCSLSSSITGKDVRLLKEKYPGVPVVSYVNTSADVKAETDVCCTSANAVKIVKSLGVKKVIFLPDDYLAKYVASQTDVEIISWKGICVVHDQFNENEIKNIRKNNPGIKIIAHPECPPEVIKASDFAGSTSGMINYVKDNQPKKVMMVTECSMSDNIQVENPNVEFIRPCNMCPHMKKITLPKILDCLENETGEIIMDRETIDKARLSVEKMVSIGR